VSGDEAPAKGASLEQQVVAYLRVLLRVRAIDPALSAQIDGILACPICMNPRHDWANQPHGDACQTISVVAREKVDALAEDYANAKSLIDQMRAHQEKCDAAVQNFWEVHEESLPEAAAADFERRGRRIPQPGRSQVGVRRPKS